MAITATQLTHGSSVVQTNSYATASITPGANGLILLAVTSGALGCLSAPAGPSGVTGCGLTWVQVAQFNTSLFLVCTLFRAMGPAPTSGALTISFGTNQDGVAWEVAEFDGVDTSGTNGSGAIVQSVTAGSAAAGTSISVTLATLADPNNASVGLIGHDTASVITGGSGYTMLGQDSAIGTSCNTYHTSLESQVPGSTTVDGTFASSLERVAIGVEVKAAANVQAPQTVNPLFRPPLGR